MSHGVHKVGAAQPQWHCTELDGQPDALEKNACFVLGKIFLRWVKYQKQRALDLVNSLPYYFQRGCYFQKAGEDRTQRNG